MKVFEPYSNETLAIQKDGNTEKIYCISPLTKAGAKIPRKLIPVNFTSANPSTLFLAMDTTTKVVAMA